MLLKQLMRAISCLIFLIHPGESIAELASLLGGNAFQTGRVSLLVSPHPPAASNVRGGAGSLFAGKGGLGLFAPHPKRETAKLQRANLSLVSPNRLSMGPSAQILDLISKAEAGAKGYDAVQHGARSLPEKPPTHMTIGEIYAWIERTPGQPHAIGRYQFIPETLKRLVNDSGLGVHETFTPQVQDILAEALLMEAGLLSVSRGQMGRQTFMNNLARIWAGLPNSSGKSHYHGYAGNRATMTWARFDSEMSKIFPS